MGVMALQQTPIDRRTRAHVIRETFARSPLFRDAAVSEPIPTSEDAVAITVSFDGGTPVVAIVAGSEDEAYAVLHELALTMVEIEQQHGLGINGGYARARGGDIRAARFGEEADHGRQER